MRYDLTAVGTVEKMMTGVKRFRLRASVCWVPRFGSKPVTKNSRLADGVSE